MKMKEIDAKQNRLMHTCNTEWYLATLLVWSSQGVTALCHHVSPTHPPRQYSTLLSCCCCQWSSDCIPCKLSCLMKRSNDCFSRSFVSPSAFISPVETQSISILWCCTSWRSQCWCISTWRSLVVNRGPCSFRSRIVWALSQRIDSLAFNLKSIWSKKRCHWMSSFAARDSASNSASMLDVVTIDYLDAF